MKSQQVINLLREKKPLLEEKFGVEKLAYHFRYWCINRFFNA
jgi:hypothetical protein